ncbi:MAG: pantetheine-phosphate adenylyltransferase, partial [Proteobacteria bacterium]|nr:pantetheine-phosphate adenylyltransferase [Pseudomonadota bacterium]
MVTKTLNHQSHQAVTAIFAGTFDPLTLGHFQVILEICELFSTVVVAVHDPSDGQGEHALPLFDTATRVALTTKSCEELSKVKVIAYRGLTVDLLKSHQPSVLIRGLRSSKDFEYERDLFDNQKVLYPAMKTIYIPTPSPWRHISSTMVR